MGILHSMEDLQDFTIAARDGEIGRVADVYFDDHAWTIRHLVVDTGGWLSGRKVLISPAAVEAVNWEGRSLLVRMSRDQVEKSPDIDTDKPVSRQQEAQLFDYYGYPYYWGGPMLWGYSALPMATAPLPQTASTEAAAAGRREEPQGDPHLRSWSAVVGYDIQASDDTVGHVDDFLFSDEDWRVALMVVDTRNWWPGKHVLISPERIERVSWESGMVMVKASREEIEHSPEYDSRRPPLHMTAAGLYRQAGNWR